MSNTKTLTDRTVTNHHVADILDEQAGNLTQRHFSKDGPYKQVRELLVKVARRAIQCALARPVEKPNLKSAGWKQKFANAVTSAMIAKGFEKDVDGYIKQLQGLMPKAVGDRATVKWSYYKIATYAGQCATMLSHGLSPDLLTMSDEEIDEEMTRRIDVAVRSGTPTIVVEVPR